MKLTDIKNGNLSAEWAEKGYELPKFDAGSGLCRPQS